MILGYLIVAFLYTKKGLKIKTLEISPSAVLWVCCVMAVIIYPFYSWSLTASWFPPLFASFDDLGSMYHLVRRTDAYRGHYWNVLISIFSIFVYSVFPLAFYYWHKISNKLKVVSSVVTLAYLIIYLSTGRNFPIFMFTASVVCTYALILFSRSRKDNRKRIFIATIIFIASIILSMSMFWLNLSSRTRRVPGQEMHLITVADDIAAMDDYRYYLYAPEDMPHFLQFEDLIITERHMLNWDIMYNTPGWTARRYSFSYINPNDVILNTLPQTLQFFYIMGSYYFTHGYHGLTVALRVPHQWTYGIGHAPIISHFFGRITGIDITSRTYIYRLRNVIEPQMVSSVEWSTTYVEFASDLTFIGVVLFMGLIGALLYVVWIEALSGKNLFAVLVFYVSVIFVAMLPLSNFFGGRPNYLLNFYGLIIFWIISKVIALRRQH